MNLVKMDFTDMDSNAYNVLEWTVLIPALKNNVHLIIKLKKLAPINALKKLLVWL